MTNTSNDLTFDSIKPPVDTLLRSEKNTTFYGDTQRRDFRRLKIKSIFDIIHLVLFLR
jgi:hypothetical protein